MSEMEFLIFIFFIWLILFGGLHKIHEAMEKPASYWKPQEPRELHVHVYPPGETLPPAIPDTFPQDWIKR